MKHRTTGLVLLCAAATAAGQPSKSPLEEIIITSSRVAMPLRQVGTSVSIIDREEIPQSLPPMPAARAMPPR
jgi:vitamin B12 transporter